MRVLFILLVTVLIGGSLHGRTSDAVKLYGSWSTDDYGISANEYYFFEPDHTFKYNVHWKTKKGVLQRLTQRGTYVVNDATLTLDQESMSRFVDGKPRYIGSGSSKLEYSMNWLDDSSLTLTLPGMGIIKLTRVAPEAVKLD